MGRRSGVTAEETREQLLSAAAATFAERGYEGARVSEIARAAGLTTGAIYAHYETKADLLLEALRSHGGAAAAQLLSEGSGGSVLDLLARAGSALPRRGGQKATLLLEAVTAGRRDPRVGKVLTATLARREELLAGLLRQAQERGEVDRGLSPEALSRLITLIAVGALVAGALQLDPVDSNEWTELINRVVDAARPTEEER
ncbi:MAG TPA: TetR family transcriptional regulator [Acidimicrobiales bacterium]|nr:TetR family transcriptional regulator [Acidimicrobiales bacterium]